MVDILLHEVKSCNRLALGNHRSEYTEFIDVFYHFNAYFAWSDFPR